MNDADKALRLVADATRAQSPAEADRLLIDAIRLSPDLGSAYAQRGTLAAGRGDPVSAAHHFRAAYARGDRSDATRAGLSLCLRAADQMELAERVRGGALTPESLEAFEEAVAGLGPVLRALLSRPLPERGIPAWLPGEAAAQASPGRSDEPPILAQNGGGAADLPDAALGSRARIVKLGAQPGADMARVSSSPLAPAPPTLAASSGAEISALKGTPAAGAGVAVIRRPSALAAASAPPGPSPPVAPGDASSSPPAPSASPAAEGAAEATEVGPRAASPTSDPPAEAAGAPRFVRRNLAGSPDGVWLERIERVRFLEPDAAGNDGPEWLASALPEVQSAGPPVVTEGIELVVDPGRPVTRVRSPVTGQWIEKKDLDVQLAGARMPEFGDIPDVLESIGDFEKELRAGLRVAVRLPGPVMTGPGLAPRQLCRSMAVALSVDELLLRDRDNARVPLVRLPLTSLARVEILNDGAQLSVSLGDHRQLHLDLRDLRRRSYLTSVALIDALSRALTD